MKWLELNLQQGPQITKQTDEVCRTYEALYKQAASGRTPNDAQIRKALAVLAASITKRIHALEAFYSDNDLEPKAAQFETQRIKLKRLLKERPVTSVIPEGEGDAPRGTPRGRGNTQSAPSPRATGNTATSSAATTPRARQQRTDSSVLSDAPTASTANDSPAYGTHPVDEVTQRDPDAVLVRLVLSAKEYEELQVRKEAMRTMPLNTVRGGGPQVMPRGTGKLAWENALRSPRGNSGREGMHTRSDAPWVDPLMANRSPRGAPKPKSFVTTGVPKAPHDPGFINQNQPYVSANPNIVQQSRMRYQSGRDMATGGDRAVDKSQPFRNVVPRTGVASEQHKLFPLGGT